MATVKKQRLKKKEVKDRLVSSFAVDFLDQKKADGRAEKTLISYKASFDRFFKYVGDIKIEELDQDLIYQYKGHLNKEREEDGLSLASANHYIRDLRTLLNWLYENEHIQKKIKIDLIKGQEKPIETYTDDEIAKLIKRPDKNNNSLSDWRSWAVICFILGTGQRIQTIVNIKIEDLDFQNRRVFISQQKNKKANAVPLDRTLIKNLKEFIDLWRSDALDDDYLFCNIEGEQLTTNALQSSLMKYNKKRGVNRTGAHKLRHTFAKIYITNGGSQFKLQKILGHSSLEMTRHYVNLFTTDLQDDFDELSPLATATRKSAWTKGVKKKQ